MDIVRNDPLRVDETDLQLIHLLQEDARTATTVLATRLGLSRTTVHARIQRLERQGIIQGYSARLSSEFESRAVRAHVSITCTPKRTPAVERALKVIREVRSVLSVSGPFDLIVVLAAPSVGELDLLLDRIGALDGVERTTSSIVLATKLDR
jgi:DNA-binding Lrp family transcriptional regulator